MPSRLTLLLAAFLAGCATASAHPRVLDGAASYPEGPLWHGGRLYVAEMHADRVSIFEEGRKHVFFTREGCGPTALAPYGDGFLILCHLEAAVVAVDAAGAVRFVRTEDGEGRAFRDPNDCYEDGRGGVYFSDPGIFSTRVPPQGSLLHIDAEGHVRRLADGLWYPNGVFVDLARRELYLSETFRHRILRFALLENGALGQMSVFADMNAMPRQSRFDPPYREAGPDGLERAPDGAMYVAIYGEARILRLSAAGAYEGQIDTAARYVTNVAFRRDGAAAVTGAFDNVSPPYAGEVRLYEPAELLGAAAGQ